MMYGVVFGIDGQQFPSRLGGGGHDQFASGDEDFFVGESDGAAEFHGFVGGFEANDTDGGGDDDVGVGMRSDGEHAFAAVVDLGQGLEILLPDLAGEFVGELFIGDRDEFGTMAEDLGEEFVKIVAGCERDDFELIGERFDDGKRLAADGAGRAEDGERIHAMCSVIRLRFYVKSQTESSGAKAHFYRNVFVGAEAPTP